MGVCVSFVYHLTVILVALLRALTQSTRSCWSLACRKNFLIPALMTYRWQKRALGTKEKVKVHSSVTIRLQYTLWITNKYTYKDILHTKTYWSVFSALSCISVRTHPLPQISLEVKNNWAKGLSHTHPAAFSLHGDDDPARLSCLRLPPPTHV